MIDPAPLPTLADHAATLGDRPRPRRLPHLENLSSPPKPGLTTWEDDPASGYISDLISLAHATAPAPKKWKDDLEPLDTLTGPLPEIRDIADRLRRRQAIQRTRSTAAEAEADMIAAETGHAAAADWKKRGPNKADELSHTLASIIGDGLALGPDRGGRRLFHADLIDETPVMLSEFRNCNFLPAVAKKNRKPIKQLLDFYFHIENAKNAKRKKGELSIPRMLVFNAGKTIQIKELKDRIKKVCKKVTNAIADVKTAQLPVDFLCRNIEISGFCKEVETTDLLGKKTKKLVLNKDENGNILFHVHSHVLIMQKKLISPKDWLRYLRAIKATSKNINKKGKGNDCGPIRAADEATKYLTKAEGLPLIPPETLRLLFASTKRTKVLHLLGPALDLKSKMKTEGWKMLAPKNGSKWRRMPIRAAKPRLPDPQATPSSKPSALTVTRPSPAVRPISTPGLLFRSRPEDAAAYVRQWQLFPSGKRVISAMKKGWEAHGLTTPETMAPEKSLLFSSQYDDSLLGFFRGENCEKSAPEIDPADLDIPTLFPDLIHD